MSGRKGNFIGKVQIHWGEWKLLSCVSFMQQKKNSDSVPEEHLWSGYVLLCLRPGIYKRGLSLYNKDCLHYNALGLYKPLTILCSAFFPLFSPQCSTYHYTGTPLNAKRMIRINGGGFTSQTFLFLQSSLFLLLLLFLSTVAHDNHHLLPAGIFQGESWGSSNFLSRVFDLPPCTFNPVGFALWTWTAGVGRKEGLGE